MTLLRGGRVRRATGALLLTTMLSGCVQWHTHTAPLQPLANQGHERVIVHPRQGADLYLFEAQILSDTVFGYERIPVRPMDRVADEDRFRGYVEKPVRIAVSDVRSIETSSVRVPIKEFFIFFGMFVVMTIVYFAIEQPGFMLSSSGSSR